MKQVAILLTSLLIALVTGCQDHNLEPHPDDVMAWRAGGPNREEGQDIAVDKSGNTYVTGYFTGTTTFGSTTLTATGASDIFIVKYNNKGEVQWAHRAGGFNTNSFLGADRGHGIVVDESGNVYVTGNFTGTATFGTISVTANSSQDIFISKFNSSGEVQWVRNAGGTGLDYGNGIAIDQSGNLYVTGSFEGTATFGSTSLTSRGSNDVFITKYNSNGDVLWAQQAGGNSIDQGVGIDVDTNGNVYITGHYYSNNATFGSISIIPANSADVFVAKYNSTGEAVWARKFGGSRWDYGTSIAVDRNGNVYITGDLYSTASFGSSTIVAGLFTSDVFLIKYNNNGEEQWAEQVGGGYGNIANDIGYGVAVDAGGNVYITGFITGSPVYFGPPDQITTGALTSLHSNGGADLFIAKYHSSGGILWARNAGGTSNDYGRGIAIDHSGTVYITGSFEGTATFGTTPLTSGGESDVFVAKFK